MAKAKGRKAQQKGKPKTGLLLGAGAGILAVVIAAMILLAGTPTVEAAPAWEATSIDGERLASGELKGDVYAVDFFFTWCQICARQYPAKQELVEHFAGRNDFHFISISADPTDTPQVLDQYRRSHDASWPFVSDTFGLYQKFEVSGRPFIVFVDRDGNIIETIRRITSADELIETAQALLDKSQTPASEPNATAAAPFALLVAPAPLALRRALRVPA